METAKKVPYIDVKNVSMFYPVKGKLFKPGPKKLVKAVNGVSFTLERGEILGIIGESGCGKSTLGRMLVRLEDPTLGDVYIDGVSTAKMRHEDQRAFCRTVQIIFQNPYDTFTPRDTIEKILIRPLRIHNIGKDYEERRQMCIESLERSGLKPADDIMRRYPHELSGGQLQRISIIRAMLLNPSFIIADEPVSMLDVSVRAEIISMLITLSEEHDAAVAFISHDIALTRYISDRIAVMYLGRVVEYGNSDDIIKNPRHPYTEALISNCASIDPFEEYNAIDIHGEPPTPIDPGPGCFFADRCPHCMERCTKEYPGATDLGGGHSASCFLLDK